MAKVSDYWSRVARRAVRLSLECVRFDSWERIIVSLIILCVPALLMWLCIGKDSTTSFRIFASLGAIAVAFIFAFLWNLIKLPAVMDAEAEISRKVLGDQQEITKQRKQRLVRLATFMDLGHKLMTASKNYTAAPPEAEAMKWLEELGDYLETELGLAYLVRVNDGTSAPIGYAGNSHPDHDRVYNAVRIRVFHLQEFLKEFSQ